MIGTNPALGNLRVWCGAARRLAPLLAVALGGCADVFFATVSAVGPAQGVTAAKGIEFDAIHHLSLDVYAPGDAALAPVVVFFYGGSWEDGKRRWYRYVGDALASSGVVTIIPDYRKYPDVRFPAFMHDAANAVAWRGITRASSAAIRSACSSWGTRPEVRSLRCSSPTAAISPRSACARAIWPE
jgi:acetyl esterase/lipase